MAKEQEEMKITSAGRMLKITDGDTTIQLNESDIDKFIAVVSAKRPRIQTTEVTAVRYRQQIDRARGRF